ncbi:MAG: hypothetical protein ACOYN0_19560, partial [Phycisphaerales bacterium]
LAAFGWAIAALRALGVLVSVWVLPAPAIAQEIIVERASFGYAGVVQAEKQTFLRLWISSGNTPWSGQISVDAPHDNTQDGSVVVAAATPGIAVPVEIPLLLASNWRKITIRATDGARVETWELDRFDEDGEGPIVSPRMDSSSRAFLAVGDVSAIRYFAVRGPDGRFTYQTNLSETEPEVTEGSEPTPPEPPSPQWGPNHEMDPESSWDRTPFEVAEGGLPVHWQCLEAYSLVVATESGLRAEQPQARSALMEWVLAGGRLLIMLDPGGEGWRGLAHPDFPINAFEAADATTSVPEASIVQIANSGRKTQIELRARPARVLKLTESGRREGWRASWPFEGASENEGCLVTGPYGFGMIGFLGVDPGDLPSLAGRFPGDAANRLWRDVIQRTAWAGRLDGILTEPSDNWWWYPASGSSSTARESLRRVLDDISIVAPLGNGLFFVLAAAMLLMAVMIGPGDAILLKKLRLRHRSWLTALGWIGVATTIAALAPSMVRTGNHAYTMMATDDVRMLPNGDAIVARTGTLGIFGGRPGWLPLPTHAQGTAWRGVSPSNHHGSGFKTTVPIRMVSREFQSLGCRGTEVIGRGPNDEKSIRVAQWTFRTLQSQEPCGYAG